MYFLFSVLVMLLVGCSYGVLRSGRLSRPQPDPDFEPRRLATHAAALLVARHAVLGSAEEASKTAAISWFEREFQLGEEEAQRLWSSAVSQAMLDPGPEEGLAVILAPIKSSCTLQEMKDLTGFLSELARAGDAPSEGQERLIAEVCRRLSLPEPLASSDPS